MKRLLTHVLLLSISILAMAESRSVEQAQNEALQFLTSGSNARGIMQDSNTKIRLEYTVQKPGIDAPAAYVFQVGETEGFILVSADDLTTTILGYSSEGRFDSNQIPENMQTWLRHYAEEIAWAASKGISMRSPMKSGGSPISPLLGQIAWNQGEPFWNSCPLDADNRRSYSGCVATAATQIMRFWNHPQRGTGSHSYTWKNSGGVSKTLSANFAATTYDWANMLASYNSSSTTRQKTAVATLMFHMGVATNMEYSSVGSGTQTELAAEALFTYFDYDKSMEALRPDYCGFKYFEERMLEELNARRPVLMSGATTKNEGHAFVCDGYDGEYFHINWGWGGSQNGYFALTALDPAEQGMGGASSGEGFSVGILGVMGIKPNEGGTIRSSQLGTQGISLKTTESSVAASASITITYNQIRNAGIISFEGGTVGFGIYDDNDRLVGYHSLSNIGNLPAGSYYPGEYDFNGDLSDVKSDGKYKIVPIYTDAQVTWQKKVLVNTSSIQEILFEKKGSTIYFPQNKKQEVGDLDNNGEITITDLSLLIRLIRNCQSGKALKFDDLALLPYADINGDGDYTGADIEALRKIILIVKEPIAEVDLYNTAFEGILGYNSTYYYWSQYNKFTERKLWNDGDQDWNSVVTGLASDYVEKQNDIPVFWDKNTQTVRIAAYYSLGSITATATDAQKYSSAGVKAGSTIEVIVYAGGSDYVEFECWNNDIGYHTLVEANEGEFQLVTVFGNQLLAYYPVKVTKTFFQELIPSASPGKSMKISTDFSRIQPIPFDRPIQLKREIRTLKRD